jgi:phosphohistidine phosphatase
VSRVAYLVRHAEAAGGAGGRDSERRLTPNGRAAFARLIGDLGPSLSVKRILSSPFLRARETSELLAAATGAAVEIRDELASGAAEGREILQVLREAGEGAAVVGHNPELAEAVGIAAAGGHAVAPGTVAAVDLSDPRPRLLWIRAPG